MNEDCYSDQAAVPMINALDNCRAELEKLKAGAKEVAQAAKNYLVGPDKEEFHPVTGLACGCCGQNIDEKGGGHEKRCPIGITIAVFRELGLLEEK